MELRDTWSIFARRAWIPIGLALIVGLASFFVNARLRATYEAETRVVVSLAPEARVGPYFAYNDYYAWLSTEYLTDDLAEIVKSYDFAQEIQRELNDPNISVERIQESNRATKTHRILSITVEGPDPETVRRIADAAGRVIERKAPEYLAPAQRSQLQVTVIDPPVVRATATALRGILDIAIRSILAFVVGLGVIFLGEYFNTSIRNAAEAQRVLDLPVLGEIPVDDEKPPSGQPRVASAEA